MYHFRFKTALIPGSDRDKNAVAVWMDCVDDSEPVPTWQSSIVAKVTRVAVEDDESYDGEFARAESTVSSGGYASSRSSIQSSSKMQSTNHSSQQSSDSLLGAFDDALAPPAPAAPSSGNLLDAHPPAPPASGGSLLDMDHIAPSSGYNSSGANTPTPSSHDDLLNMTAPMPATNDAPPQYNAQQQQQQRPPQQRPMQGSMHGSMNNQYPMQGMGGPMNTGQQRMGMMPAPQGMGMQQMQQQQQQQSNNSSRGQMANGAGGKNAFDKFSGSSLDPLGNLKWS